MTIPSPFGRRIQASFSAAICTTWTLLMLAVGCDGQPTAPAEPLRAPTPLLGASIGADGVLHLNGSGVRHATVNADFVEDTRFLLVGSVHEKQLVRHGRVESVPVCSWRLQRQFTSTARGGERFVESRPGSCEWVIAVGQWTNRRQPNRRSAAVADYEVQSSGGQNNDGYQILTMDGPLGEDVAETYLTFEWETPYESAASQNVLADLDYDFWTDYWVRDGASFPWPNTHWLMTSDYSGFEHSTLHGAHYVGRHHFVNYDAQGMAFIVGCDPFNEYDYTAADAYNGADLGTYFGMPAAILEAYGEFRGSCAWWFDTDIDYDVDFGTPEFELFAGEPSTRAGGLPKYLNSETVRDPSGVSFMKVKTPDRP